MQLRSLGFLVLAVAGAGCGRGAVMGIPSTGLSGIVMRGPVMLVCQTQAPCDAPFSASFTVQTGGRTVAVFRSDSLGHFEVQLAPGAYVVVPGADAPIISPSSQTKPVTVGPTGLTPVQLDFDTGIR